MAEETVLKGEAGEKEALTRLSRNKEDYTALLFMARRCNEQLRFPEALAYCERCLSLGHETDDVFVVAVSAAARSGDIGLAEFYSIRAERLGFVNGQYPAARGLQQLRRREYLVGWRNYAYRRHSNAFIDRMPRRSCREWTGQDLTGRSILVIAEQGLGDAIMFARYLPLLRDLGADVHVRLQVPLVRLFQHTWPWLKIVPYGETAPRTEFAVQMIDIMAVLGHEFEKDPLNGRAYLACVPKDQTDWHGRLVEYPAPRIGFVWAGNAIHAMDFNRSLTLDALRPVLSVSGVGFYSFQRDEPREQVLKSRNWGPRIIDIGSAFADMAETAGALMSMDLVITADTSVAHLASALGRPVWMFCPAPADWRWGTDGGGISWYPQMRIYRQRVTGDWHECITAVSQDLAHWRDHFHDSGVEREAAFLEDQAELLLSGRIGHLENMRLAGVLRDLATAKRKGG